MAKKLHCSFCGKSEDEIAKLVAGPSGIYICDECVGLCDDILAAPTSAEEAAAHRAAFEHRSVSEILEALPAVARTADAVESDLRGLIERLRASDTSWQVIAARLGIDPELARVRFERL